MKILMFSTHLMKYIWYSPQKSKYPLFISLMRGKTTKKIWKWHLLLISGVAFTIKYFNLINTLSGKLNMLQDLLVSDCHIDLNNRFQKMNSLLVETKLSCIRTTINETCIHRGYNMSDHFI